eukprot:TRINITY_DN535_c0_g1_i1.p1 TRINITY_DN535_c0_g1~~TRINITY_DN535_c0_g1_i1.p1  ORF type:complete len:474 (+),score=71.30 TRINITY_DN535_c0_g1_i1:63-1424(+)
MSGADPYNRHAPTYTGAEYAAPTYASQKQSNGWATPTRSASGGSQQRYSDSPSRSGSPAIGPGANTGNTNARAPQSGVPIVPGQNLAVVPHHPSSQGGYVPSIIGFANLGNSCFLNATLQCLIHLPQFRHAVASIEPELVNPASTTRGEVALALANLMHRVEDLTAQGGVKTISPQSLHQLVERHLAGRYPNSHARQHDAHECLRFLLSAVINDLRPGGDRLPQDRRRVEPNKRKSDMEMSEAYWQEAQESAQSDIAELFCGQLKSTLRCLACQRVSRRFEQVLDLSIPVKFAPAGNYVTIHQCLDTYTTEELQSESNGWNCPRCRRRQPLARRVSLFRFPQILTVHLNRFTSDGRKTLSDVEFPRPPALLHLTRLRDPNGYDAHMNRPVTYALLAVVNHHGESPVNGHYTAVVEDPDVPGGWLLCDDEVCRPVGPEYVVTPDAFLLFYSRVD